MVLNIRSTLVQVKDWCLFCAKPLLTRCYRKLCNTGTKLIEIGIKLPKNACKKMYSKAYIDQWYRSSRVQIMAWCLIGARPLSKSMITYCISDPKEWIAVEKYNLEMSAKCWSLRHHQQAETHNEVLFLDSKLLRYSYFKRNWGDVNNFQASCFQFHNTKLFMKGVGSLQ